MMARYSCGNVSIYEAIAEKFEGISFFVGDICSILEKDGRCVLADASTEINTLPRILVFCCIFSPALIFAVKAISSLLRHVDCRMYILQKSFSYLLNYDVYVY